MRVPELRGDGVGVAVGRQEQVHVPAGTPPTPWWAASGRHGARELLDGTVDDLRTWQRDSG